MAAGLKAGGGNHIHAHLLQGNGFVHGGRRSNQGGFPAAELIQYLFGRDAINKTECGDPFVQENLNLIFETNRFIGAVGWPRSPYIFNMLCKGRGCDGMPLPSK